MLELQLPQPMPHAVPSHAFDFFPPHPSTSKQEQHILPLPRSYSGTGGPGHTSSIVGRQALTYSSSPLTPPSDMYNSNGAYLASRQYGPKRSEFGSSRELYANGVAPSAYRGPTDSAYQSLIQNGSRPATRPSSPKSHSSGADSTHDPNHRRKSSITSIAVNLRIPSTIKTPQSSMPQLAAEITCLFWFENSSTLTQVIESGSPRAPICPLVPDAMPTSGFRKWVTTILSTTQVAQNVILLALLFIYRLKMINPSVKGKPGSEYRLLTVALMLGNKFLDDNTYTNKTWAEVSGISVMEVHIMEVEFLSNMRYSLFTSKAQWEEWHITLGKFGTFFDKASRMALEVAQKANSSPTPTLHVPPAFPSPPISSNASPPAPTSYSPSHVQYSNTPMLLPQISSSAVSPIGPLPELELRPNARKRSYDDQAGEPPAKRAAPVRNFMQTVPTTSGTILSSSAAPTLPRLPLPSLSIPPMQSGLGPVQLGPQLPPPGGRTMSVVYPLPVQWSQPPSQPTSGVPVHTSSQTPANVSYGNPSRQASPFPGSATSSPVSATFPSSAAQMSNQNRLSPSYFLSQRQSPYRPVRSVQTLLVPPPSASMQNTSRHVPFDHMQYQPLGRPLNERRAGVVPYMNHEAWPDTNQFNQWPVLPQPNFTR